MFYQSAGNLIADGNPKPSALAGPLHPIYPPAHQQRECQTGQKHAQHHQAPMQPPQMLLNLGLFKAAMSQ